MIGALATAAAVAAGAFGAHALRGVLGADRLATYATAVEYHFYHGLGVLAIGVLLAVAGESRWLSRAGWLLTLGLVLFSGSLYALALTGIRGFGFVTPIGGVSFMAGWVLVAVAIRAGALDRRESQD